MKKAYSTSYGALHHWVRQVRGRPQHCEDCGTTEPRRYEWANLTGNYTDPNDYKRLCKPCHARMDNTGRKAGDKKIGVRRPDMQGERHRTARLTEQNVLEIRRRAVSESYVSLGREFGVQASHISRVFHRQLWKHVAPTGDRKQG